MSLCALQEVQVAILQCFWGVGQHPWATLYPEIFKAMFRVEKHGGGEEYTVHKGFSNSAPSMKLKVLVLKLDKCLHHNKISRCSILQIQTQDSL